MTAIVPSFPLTQKSTISVCCYFYASLRTGRLCNQAMAALGQDRNIANKDGGYISSIDNPL